MRLGGKKSLLSSYNGIRALKVHKLLVSFGLHLVFSSCPFRFRWPLSYTSSTNITVVACFGRWPKNRDTGGLISPSTAVGAKLAFPQVALVYPFLNDEVVSIMTQKFPER